MTSRASEPLLERGTPEYDAYIERIVDRAPAPTEEKVQAVRALVRQVAPAVRVRLAAAQEEGAPVD